MKNLILLLVMAVTLGAQGARITTLADITGDGAAHAITSVSTNARWVLFISPPANSATAIRVGDVNISSTRGAPMAAGGTLFYPSMATGDRAYAYDLATIYYLVANGDKLSIQWVN